MKVWEDEPEQDFSEQTLDFQWACITTSHWREEEDEDCDNKEDNFQWDTTEFIELSLRWTEVGAVFENFESNE